MKYYYHILCLGFLACHSPILADQNIIFTDPDEEGGAADVFVKQPDQTNPVKMLKLLNGDAFPAEFKLFIPKKKSLTGGAGADRLRLSSVILHDDIEMDITKLQSLEVSTLSKAAAGFALVQMSNGTYLWGRLLNTSGEHIEVETMWGGKIPLKKKMIASINMRSPSTFFYVGTDDLTGWKQGPIGSDSSEDTPEVWQVENGCFVSRGVAPRVLSRTLELPEKVKVELRLHYKGYNLRSTIALWGDRDDKGKLKQSLFLDVQGGFCRLYLGSENSPTRTLGSARFKVDYSSETEKTMDIVFYADKAKRRFILYVNGLRVGVWGGDNALGLDEDKGDPFGGRQGEDKGEDKGDPFEQWKGGKEVFVAVSGLPVTISQLSIARWRGSDPAMMLKDAGNMATDASAKEKREGENATAIAPASPLEKSQPEGTAKIQLLNGDLVIGEILEIGDAHVRVKTLDYTVNIPINRTLGLNLGDLGEGSTQRLYANDVRLELVDKSNLILDLRSFDGSKLTGFSEATGLVEIKPDSIRNIFFNVHATKKDDKSNSQGESKSSR